MGAKTAGEIVAQFWDLHGGALTYFQVETEHGGQVLSAINYNEPAPDDDVEQLASWLCEHVPRHVRVFS